MARLKRAVGRETGLNCWLFVALLLVRGRLRGVLLCWTGALPHAVGVTRRGNLVHFRRVRGTPRTCSLWFPGVAEVFGACYAAGLATRVTRISF